MRGRPPIPWQSTSCLVVAAALLLACGLDDAPLRTASILPIATVAATGVLKVGSCEIRPQTQCPDANLRGADLRRMDLSGADLSGADLSDAELEETNLARADLSGAGLSGANLNRADLRQALLIGADLRDAHLVNADARGADVTAVETNDGTERSQLITDETTRGGDDVAGMSSP